MEPVYWVLAASLLVWGGLFFYLMGMEGRVRRLENRTRTEDRE
jgi:hypothetical protein